MSINSTPQAGDTITDAQYCDLELQDDTYGWEKDTSSGETQWVYKPGEVQQGADAGAGGADGAGAADGGAAEDDQVAAEIGTQGAADTTAAVETSALTDEEKAQLESARGELAKINEKIKENNGKLNDLEYQITVLQDEIEEKLNEAIQKSEDIEEEQKEKAQRAVKENLNDYINANGDMTYEEFMENLSGELNGISRNANSKLTSAVRKIIEAESKFTTLDGLLGSLKDTINENENLKTQAQAKQTEIQNFVTKVTEKNSSVDKDINTDVEEVENAQDFKAKSSALEGRRAELENLETTAMKNVGVEKEEISKLTTNLTNEAKNKGEDLDNIFAQWDKEEQENQEEN